MTAIDARHDVGSTRTPLDLAGLPEGRSKEGRS